MTRQVECILAIGGYWQLGTPLVLLFWSALDSPFLESRPKARTASLLYLPPISCTMAKLRYYGSSRAPGKSKRSTKNLVRDCVYLYIVPGQ
jgi:hypothetical protein